MASLRLSGKTKKAGFAAFLTLVFIVAVASALVLVRSAKLHTGNVEGITTGPPVSGLSVKSASETPLATSDTGASATLQGASPEAGNTNTGALSSNNGVSVQQAKPTTKMTCDDAAQAKFKATYTTQTTKENDYHKSMLNMLGSEGPLMLNNENTRHTTALTKLKTTLNTSLAAIACPLAQ